MTAEYRLGLAVATLKMVLYHLVVAGKASVANEVRDIIKEIEDN